MSQPVSEPVWYPKGSTTTDLVHRVAASCGKTVTDEEAGYILWNATGYPEFFMGDPIKDMIRQLREFFLGIEHCACCGKYRELEDPWHEHEGGMDVCIPCYDRLRDEYESVDRGQPTFITDQDEAGRVRHRLERTNA